MYGAAEATSRMSYLNWKDSLKELAVLKGNSRWKFHLIDSKGKK